MMFPFLEGFEKRMEWVGVVESIVNRKQRIMEIEDMFKGAECTNLIFSVLIYIMEKTLSEDSDCDIEHITGFLDNVLHQYYGMDLSKDKVYKTANYIVKNVLQNLGAPYNFRAVNYSKGNNEDILIRMIDDKVQEQNGSRRVTYTLTKQGYEFLFRTKEVDEEIQMTMEELKLKELIKRKNFKKAQEQSLNLINMVRQKKKEINLFMNKIRENIHSVDINEYEKLMQSTFDLLNEEYDLLNEIMELSRKSEKNIRSEVEKSRGLDEKLKKAQVEIKQINNNIITTLSEQRELILNRQSLSELYIDTISNSFAYSFENRYDFEENILSMMEKHVDLVEDFWKLVNPLFLPNIYKNMNIRAIYERQGILKQEEETQNNFIEHEELIPDEEIIRTLRYNEIYLDIFYTLVKYSKDNNGCIDLKEIVQKLEINNKDIYDKILEDRLLFTTILKLYEIGKIDVQAWRENDESIIMNPTDEFNVDYCLYKLIEEKEIMKFINTIYIEKKNEEIITVDFQRKINNEMKIKETVEMSNFLIRVD